MDLQKDAVAEIWLDGKLLVKSDNIKLFQSWDFNMEETKVTITFDSPAKLEKGRKYKFVLPAGTFCSHDNPEIKSDVYSKDIELTNWLSCKDSQLFDGCAGAIDHESRKGMGIGLSICKSIVMAHQGDVHARNYEDGAEFSFSLPMDEKELTEEKEL